MGNNVVCRRNNIIGNSETNNTIHIPFVIIKKAIGQSEYTGNISLMYTY